MDWQGWSKKICWDCEGDEQIRQIPDDRSQITELIKGALLNNEQACRGIINIYKGKIFSYVFRIVRNYDDAEELTFETFIRCFKSLKSYDCAKPFSTWLFAIAHNLTIDFLRKNKQAYEYLDERHSVDDDFIKEYEKKKKIEKIEQALAKLVPVDREIVILFHKEEKSYQEISEILGIPVTTARTRLHRARKKLARLVFTST